MKRFSPNAATSPVTWFATVGAPFSWGIQFTASYWLTQAQCGTAPAPWGVSTDTWTLVLTVLCSCLAAGAGITAVTLFRRTREAETDDAPPAGRVRFLATVGMAVAALFICLIVMTGVGVITLPDCQQS